MNDEQKQVLLKIAADTVAAVVKGQKPGEVRTKVSKTIYTHFFPVGVDIREIVIDWIKLL